jgi:hypothetical protein
MGRAKFLPSLHEKRSTVGRKHNTSYNNLLVCFAGKIPQQLRTLSLSAPALAEVNRMIQHLAFTLKQCKGNCLSQVIDSLIFLSYQFFIIIFFFKKAKLARGKV